MDPVGEERVDSGLDRTYHGPLQIPEPSAADPPAGAAAQPAGEGQGWGGEQRVWGEKQGLGRWADERGWVKNGLPAECQ